MNLIKLKDPVGKANHSASTCVQDREGTVENGDLNTPDASDEDLFLSACAGEVEDFGALIKRHETRLFSLLMRLSGGDKDLADDLFQDTFLRAAKAGSTFDAGKKFRPWITAIAVNLFRDQARKRKIRSEVGLGADDENGTINIPETSVRSPDAQAEKNDEATRVNRSLALLTEKERVVVLLHFYDGMTLVEVAQTLEIPVGTVKSRLHSGLTRLRQNLNL